MMNQDNTDSTAQQYGQDDFSFLSAGGGPGIKELVEEFYRQMDKLPEAKTIREMHPKDLTVSIDKLYRFLCAWMGGPKLFQEKYGAIQLPVAHSKFSIGPMEKEAWLLCMKKALDKQPYKADFKQYLLERLNVPASRIQNKE